MAKQKDEPAAPSVATQLRNLLTKATADDVKELDTEIEAKETELAGLRANRKLLAHAVGIEEPKRTWSRKAKGPKPLPTPSGAKPAAGWASLATQPPSGSRMGRWSSPDTRNGCQAPASWTRTRSS